MKTRLTLIGLVIAVAALGFWVATINSSITDTNNQITALDKKVATALHDAAEARTQSKQTVEFISTQSAAEGTATMGKNQVAANPQAAIAAAQAMPPGPDRDGAMMDALVAYAAVDPQAAWDAAQNFPENAGKGRTQLLEDILKEWAAKDPAMAASKFDALSVTETSASATNTVGTIESDWLKQDLEAASKWVETLPVGNTRDSAIRALVPIVAESDPPTAFRWSDTLADPSYRGVLINLAVTAWAKIDPAAATQAVLARPNKNNGRQEALLELIKENAPNPPASP